MKGAQEKGSQKHQRAVELSEKCDNQVKAAKTVCINQ